MPGAAEHSGTAIESSALRRSGATAGRGITQRAPRSVEGDAVRVALWTAVSRITGLGRVVVVAAVLGPTYLGNLFQATYIVPALVYQLLVGSLFAALLVPPLVRRLDAGDLPATRSLAGGFLSVSALAFVAVAVVTMAVAPLILSLFAAGVKDPGVAANQR